MAAKHVRLAAKEAMQRHGYDPIDVLVMIAQADGASMDTRKDIATTLLPFMYPKLTAITAEAEVIQNTSVEQQEAFVLRILSDPELSDAAQRLSIAASEMELEREAIDVVPISGGRNQQPPGDTWNDGRVQ